MSHEIITKEASGSLSSCTVIFLHGFGGNGSEWTWLADTLHKSADMQDVRFVFPNAGVRTVTLWSEEGDDINAWFDLPSWNDIEFAKNDISGMDEAQEVIDKIIDKELRNGRKLEDIYLGGFSQGGSLSLLVGLLGRFAGRLGGIMSFASYLPAISRVEEVLTSMGEIPINLPILIANGNADPQIKWNWGDRTQRAVTRFGIRNVDFITYRGVGHETCEEMVEDLANWLRKTRGLSQDFTPVDQKSKGFKEMLGMALSKDTRMRPFNT